MDALGAVRGFIDAGSLPGRQVEHVLELSGGFSGTAVVLAWVEQSVPIVVKFGTRSAIEREVGGRNAGYVHNAELLRIGVDHTGPTLTVQTTNGEQQWTSMAYLWEGGLSHHEAARMLPFGKYLDEFYLGHIHRAAIDEVFRQLLTSLGAGKILQPTHGAPLPLSRYLPPVYWESSVANILGIVEQLFPDNNSIRGIQDWFERSVGTITIAPEHDARMIHGDLWFANVLIDHVKSDARIIDYGNAVHGHIFQDLARFEVDLWLDGGTKRVQIPEESIAHIVSCITAFDLPRGKNDIASAVGIWRDALAEARPSMGNRATFEMYLWFLLVDCVKRLRWIEAGSDSTSIAPVLLDAIGLIRRRIERVDNPIPSVVALNSLQRRLGVIAAYVPLAGEEARSNAARNQSKWRAISRAADQADSVLLLAETGHAFLSPRGYFRDPVTDLLQRGGHLRVVLQDENEGVRLLRDRGQTLADIRSYKRKAADARDGLMDLIQRFGDRVESVRVAQSLPATILLASDRAFFEPYLPSTDRERRLILFDTFEVEIERSIAPHMFEVLHAHWLYLYASAEPEDAR